MFQFFAPLLLLLVISAGALANPYSHRLSNGLLVIVKEDTRAPTVVQQVWYRVGSMDEDVGTTGVAHALEHLMFKGTRRFKAGEFSRRITEVGGRENAFTSQDYTVYFQLVHRDRLPLIMELEADRMANLLVRPEDFAPEIKVVMEERRLRTEDQPRALLHENFMAAAFTAHPYHWPVIGWMGDLRHMTWRDARAWYRRWYAPNNATLVIVGDVQAPQVFKWAERYYGKIARRALPERKVLEEPRQRGLRRITVKAPADQAYVVLGCKVPVLRDVEKDTEPYALEVLAGLLDANDSARLNQHLVRERRTANSVSASYDWTERGPGMLVLSGAVAQGKSAQELERALRDELARVASEDISADELARVKTQVVAHEVYKRDSLFAQAMELGALESVGLDYRNADRMIEKLREVTADQVKAVAARYCVEDSLTVAVLEPQPLPAGDRTAVPPGLKH